MIGREELSVIMSKFLASKNRRDGNVTEFDTGIGLGKLIYVKHKNQEYRSIIIDMFGSADIYRHNSDFILFKLDDKVLAIGTYTYYDTSLSIDETEDMVTIVYNELRLAQEDVA